MRDGQRQCLSEQAAQGNLQLFLANMNVFLRGEPQNEPLSRPLREFGWAEEAGQRIEQHSFYQSSNNLMNLFEAVARGWFRWDFRNEAAVIYLCFDRPQAAVNEIV